MATEAPTTAEATGIIDLKAVLDDQPLGNYRLGIFLLLLLAMFADGYDISCIAYAAPMIIGDLGVSKSMFAVVFSAGTIGLIGGSGLAGLAGDVFGRRRTIILSTVLACVASFGTVTAHDIASLSFWRFVTGIGVGALSPACLVMANEYAPSRIRTFMVMAMLVGATAGGTGAGGLISALVAPTLGWTIFFFFGGLLSLLVALLLIWRVPESLKFLYVKNADPMEIARIAKRVQPSLIVRQGWEYSWGEEIRSANKVPYRLIFANGRASMTLVLWASFFVAQALVYGLSSWLPTMLASSGVAAGQVAGAMIGFAVLGLVSGLIFARLVDRIGIVVLAALPLLGVPLVSLVGSLPNGSGLQVIAVAATGLSMAGALYGLSAISGALYPTAIRSNGVGLAFLVSRGGSVLGPLLLGWMLGNGASIESIFLSCIPLLIFNFLATWLLARLARRARAAEDNIGSVSPA